MLPRRAPDGAALGVRVPDLAARAAWLAEHPQVFFLVAQYEPFPMVLLYLERTPIDVLDEAVTESWLARAPKRLTQPWLRSAGLAGP